MKVARLIAIAAAGLLAAGCGSGPNFVKVSGVVTLNGKPYPNAVVSFQPVGSKENPNPGEGSVAITDANGRFELKTRSGQNGAVVGQHRVRIQTNRQQTTGAFDPQTGSPDQGPRVRVQAEPIPVDWYSTEGNHEFTVPAGGTDQANFDIETKKK